jgi:hypothetical protein
MSQNLPATLLRIVFRQVTEYAADGEHSSGGGGGASGDQAANIHRHVTLPQKQDIVADMLFRIAINTLFECLFARVLTSYSRGLGLIPGREYQSWDFQFRMEMTWSNLSIVVNPT